uniref:RING-type domain-containing protein n=1 Tax=Trichobilharzia regenti TaxID=157069 RepID=A0AA85J6M1_TRIRE|nr:unnamed protein product [Trichobilharzia regenti]
MVRRRSTKCAAQKNSEPAPEERSFVNPSAVSLHVFCPICQEAFSNPQRAPCGHSFCKGCIDPWIRDSPTCPVDRLPIPKGSMHHDFIVENIIGEYMVSCPWRSLGCDFIGRLCILPSHKKMCPMNPEHLPAELRNRIMVGLQNTTNGNQSSDLNCYSYNEKLSKAQQEPAPPTVTSDDSNESNASTSHENSLLSQNVGPSLYDTRNNESVDEDHLLPAPPPCLLFRLYQNSDENGRSLLCNFLRSDQPSESTSTSAGNKRRRRR